MNRIWKYLFRGTTLAGAALLCVCFWLPLAEGCTHTIVPAKDVGRNFLTLFGLFFPFLVAAITILLLLLKWILRNRVAQAVVIVLACVVSVTSLAWFGASLLYGALPNWVDAGMKWEAYSAFQLTMASIIYISAGVALYALYKSPRRIYFDLSVFWCGFLPLIFFSAYGIPETITNSHDLLYGFYIAWPASAVMCAGAAAELYRQWRTPPAPPPPSMPPVKMTQIESGKSE